MDLVCLYVGQLALRGYGQRAKRNADNDEDGNPGTYDADTHDRTLSASGPRRKARQWPGPLKSYLSGRHD